MYTFSQPLTVTQTAEVLGMSGNTVRELCRCGQLKAYTVNPNSKNKSWRITPEAIKAYRNGGK